MDLKSIGLTGVENARQLGGYVGADGRKIKENVLLRTGKLAKATDADIERLDREYHLTEVVDFRTAFERNAEPDPELSGVRNHHIGILDEEGAQTAGMAAAATGSGIDMKQAMEYIKSGTMADMYVDIATNPVSMKGYARFFEILSDHGEGAILWHCSAGKDRAGFASVLILAALGVDRGTILDDYVLTNQYYQKMIDGIEKHVRKLGFTDEEIRSAKAIAGAEPQYLERAFDAVDRRYGSMDAYLENGLGLSVENRQKLQEIYLEI